MLKDENIQDQVHESDISQSGTEEDVREETYIVDQPGKVSDETLRIFEEVKVRRALVLKLLADH